MESNSTNSPAVRHHLRQLTTIRYIALGGQALALLMFAFIYPIAHLPLKVLGGITLFFFLLNTATLWRTQRPKPISESEFFGHLMFDIVGLTALLYFSGGATNPFISYFLVPISIAAATLHRKLAWAVTALAFLAYSLLLVFYLPIPDLLPTLHHQGLNLHIIGMWVNFIISAGLITYFVFTMAAQMRLQEQQLSQQREAQLQDEQVLGVATLAAGAAHELGTPLNTMKLLIDSTQQTINNGDVVEKLPELNNDLITLQQQIDRCRDTLKKLVQSANIIDEADEARSVHRYVENIIEKWRILRPHIIINSVIDNNSPELNAYFHPTVEQALHNLLNNAADASQATASQTIDIRAHWDRHTLFISIRDFGSGMDSAAIEALGKPVRSDKPHGLGLGLFLAYSTLTRHDGSVTFRNIDSDEINSKHQSTDALNIETGTLTEVTLPLREQRL
ncbi:MAG: HAMP domain-containing histidine kinase [Porticoccaceae bacterium]|nr:HAMP domain-containing histidine kinase [Porticoccaceae bacterium]